MTDEMNWVELIARRTWIPETEGEILEGVIIDITEGQYGGKQWIISVNGEEYKTPAHRYLQSMMSVSEVKRGQFVKIVFVEKQAAKNHDQNPTYIYKVFVNKK